MAQSIDLEGESFVREGETFEEPGLIHWACTDHFLCRWMFHCDPFSRERALGALEVVVRRHFIEDHPGDPKTIELLRRIAKAKDEFDRERQSVLNEALHASDCSSEDPSCFYQAGCDCKESERGSE